MIECYLLFSISRFQLAIINYEEQLEARHYDLSATGGNDKLWQRAFGI